MSKKTSTFTGWKEVFSFTASQNIKGSKFISSTIIIGIVIMIAFAMCSVLPAITQLKSDEQDIVDEEQYKDGFENVKRVYVINGTEYSDESMKVYLSAANEQITNQGGFLFIDEITNTMLKDENAIFVDIKNESDSIKLYVLLTSNTKISEEVADKLAEMIVYSTNIVAFSICEMDEDMIAYLSLPTYSDVADNDEHNESIGELLAKIFVPMAIALFMYMVILLYGQSISQAVVADKSSKLIEVLLTSVRPYAIIAGKVLGTASVAILQIMIWVVLGVIGYLVGGIIAESINPDYTNVFNNVINVMRQGSGSAFTIPALILGLVAVVVGFFMYSVFAGLAGSCVSKIEDLSSVNAIFQLPVAISFSIAYFTSLLAVSGDVNPVLLDVVRMVPITAPFIISADIIVGNVSLVTGGISILLMVASCYILILLTGKIYKGKIFNKR